MAQRFYSASLSRTQGRSTYAIIFRHPKRNDPSTGKEGLRVRQSLKTENEPEAEQLRIQMTTLLSSPDLWDLGARDQALAQFDPRIVDIFFYKLEGAETDFLAIRDGAIELPSSKSSEYRRALLLGTTASGKTTLLRQIMGTDPEKERFPSTSPAKTTVHETEVFLQEGLFRAVVTFFPIEDVREHLKECVSAAILSAYRKEPDAEVMRRLLNHVHQRFRFNYVLGNGPIKEVNDFDDDVDNNTESEASEKLKRTNEVLSLALTSVKELATRHGNSLRLELNATEETDQRVLDELFEEDLDNRTRDDEDFYRTIDSLMDEIEERFSALSEISDGRLQKTKVGWPLAWSWQSPDREAFIKVMTKFSSNYSPLFGTLLTPLVNGVRVAGPFHPTASNTIPKLVLLDGEGLGHTPRSASTISTALSKKLDTADAIVLVDNAMQPMQAAPVAAMKEIASAGSASKLIFAFAQFDRITGDNLPTSSARAQHVLASAENVLAAIGEDLGPFAERALRNRLDTSRVFLSNLNRKLEESSVEDQRTIKQLSKLLQMIDSVVERPTPSKSRPVYGTMNLGFAIKAAIENFHNEWRALLGQPSTSDLDKAPWQKIKALSRRFATQMSDEYDYLRPVKDLQQKLQQKIYVHLQNPLSWTGPEPTDDDKQQIFDAIAEDLSRRLIALASRKIKAERLTEWRHAFNESGPRSTFRRASFIAEDVYDRAAPIPDISPSPDRNGFLLEVADAIR